MWLSTEVSFLVTISEFVTEIFGLQHLLCPRGLWRLRGGI